METVQFRKCLPRFQSVFSSSRIHAATFCQTELHDSANLLKFHKNCFSCCFRKSLKPLKCLNYLFFFRKITNPFNFLEAGIAKVIIKNNILTLFHMLFNTILKFPGFLFSQKTFKNTIICTLSIAGKDITDLVSSLVVSYIICHNNIMFHYHFPI